MTRLIAAVALTAIACSPPPLAPARIVKDLWPESQRIRWTSGEQDRPCSFLGSDRPWDPSRRVPAAAAVSDLAGAPVARIAVKQYDSFPDSLNRRPTWSEFERRVQRAWRGKPETPASVVVWAEYFRWEIVAILEFAGSDKRGCLATDGFHVNVRDVEGHSWYTRVPQ